MKLFYYCAVASAVPDYEKSSTFSCNEQDICDITFENGPTFRSQADSNGLIEFNLRFAQSPAGENRWKPPIMIDEYGVDVIDTDKQEHG